MITNVHVTAVLESYYGMFMTKSQLTVVGYIDTSLVSIYILFSTLNIHGNNRQVMVMMDTRRKHGSDLPQ